MLQCYYNAHELSNFIGFLEATTYLKTFSAAKFIPGPIMLFFLPKMQLLTLLHSEKPKLSFYLSECKRVKLKQHCHIWERKEEETQALEHTEDLSPLDVASV